MIESNELCKYLDKFLNIHDYNDYGPNGLQVTGQKEIRKLAFAVSATRHSIERAVEVGAHALIVHHGLFWKFHGTRPLTNAFYHRVAPLIKNDINLLGYHLPLDAHLEIGNAASLANKLGLVDIAPFGDYKGMPTGVKGQFKNSISPQVLEKELATILGHKIIHSSPSTEDIRSIGIITGGANSEWIQCKRENLDAYLTGEISEHDWHEAQEDNIHFFAGGHNATEQFGIQSLMQHLHEVFHDKKLEFYYIPSENPA